MSQQKQQTKIVNPCGECLKPVIRWNEDRTDLIDTGEKINLREEYKARAKGTTPYELINACGGYDNLCTIIPQPTGTVQDLGEIPEFEHQLQELADKVIKETIQKNKEHQANQDNELEQLRARVKELEASQGGQQ